MKNIRLVFLYTFTLGKLVKFCTLLSVYRASGAVERQRKAALCRFCDAFFQMYARNIVAATMVSRDARSVLP